MKNLYLIFLLTFLVTINSQDFQISNMNGYSVDYPHVAFSGNYSSIIFGTNLRYYRFDINGPSTAISEAIIPADNYGPNTTDIAVDPDDPNHIAIAYDDYNYDYDSGISFYASYITESTDGGVVWDEPTLLDTIQYGNSIDNILYNIPRVEFMDGSPMTLWRVHSNSVDTNAIYYGSRYGARNRIDDPTNSDLELAIGLTVEYQPSSAAWWTAISYGKAVNGNVRFYLCHSQGGLPSHDYTELVKDDGQTFLTIDHLTKAFFNPHGTMKYIYSDFAHNPQVSISEDWGSTWRDAGSADPQKYTYIAFDRIAPDYYIKLFLDSNNDIVYYVGKDLISWQYVGKLNSNASVVEGYAGSFLDIACDADNKFIVSAWIDSRTGNDEIFYGKAPLPEITDVQNEKSLPQDFALYQNYPNPFNPTTIIKFGLPESGLVQLTVYNILGEEVAQLVNNEMTTGYHEVNFDSGDLSSGMYIYRINFGNKFTSIKKMLLLK